MTSQQPTTVDNEPTAQPATTQERAAALAADGDRIWCEEIYLFRPGTSKLVKFLGSEGTGVTLLLGALVSAVMFGILSKDVHVGPAEWAPWAAYVAAAICVRSTILWGHKITATVSGRTILTLAWRYHRQYSAAVKPMTDETTAGVDLMLAKVEELIASQAVVNAERQQTSPLVGADERVHALEDEEQRIRLAAAELVVALEDLAAAAQRRAQATNRLVEIEQLRDVDVDVTKLLAEAERQTASLHGQADALTAKAVELGPLVG